MLLGHELLTDPDLFSDHKLLLNDEDFLHDRDDQPVALLSPLLGRIDRPVHPNPLDLDILASERAAPDLFALFDGFVDPDLSEIDHTRPELDLLFQDRHANLSASAGERTLA